MVSDLPTSHINKKTNQLSRIVGTTCCAVGMAAIALSALLLLVYPISNDIIPNVYARQLGTTVAMPASTKMADPPIHNVNSNTINSNSNNTNTLFDLGTATAKAKPDKVTLILGVETTKIILHR